MSSTRELYGGALSARLPSNVIDARLVATSIAADERSDIRQIPDHEEVFLTREDISIIFEAGHNDTVQFALRQLMRRTRSDLTLNWMVDGYARGIGAGRASEATTPRKKKWQQ